MNTKENRWTEEEVEYLSANYGHVPDKDIAERTGRTLDAVRMKAAAMGRSLSVVYEQLKKARMDGKKTRH